MDNKVDSELRSAGTDLVYFIGLHVKVNWSTPLRAEVTAIGAESRFSCLSVSRHDGRMNSSSAVDLYWLPLGAGGRCVALSGYAFDALSAGYEHRPRADLFHSALQVQHEGRRFSVEMAPVWKGSAPDRGVVCEGPVGMSILGRFRWFRYEVRCWEDGVIPDLLAAVASPQRLSTSDSRASRVLDAVTSVPRLTWGRDALDLGEMWNSNSLISWLLTRSGHDLSAIVVPDNGRAPGWNAGVSLARRSDGGSRRIPCSDS